MPGALSGFRIIECGEMVSAAYASKLMADMGAEVIKIESPHGGDTARQRGPFPGGKPHAEKSGLYLFLNTNKRGITLDLEQPQGQEVFQRLVKDADLLIHNVHPKHMPTLGLDYDRLAALNPGLVMTSITPFGLRGPHTEYEASDLTLWNAGGLCFLNGGGPGSDHLPPLKAFGQQSGFTAGVHAAVASLGALFAGLRNGLGQHVEFSVQECLMGISEFGTMMAAYAGMAVTRLGHKPIQPLDLLECKDGWIFICCVEEHHWHSFVDLMDNPEWAAEPLFEDRLKRGESWDALKLLIQDWVKDFTVQDLYLKAQARRIPFAPVSTMGYLLNSEHLNARGFFVQLDHPEAGRLTYPGAPHICSETPWELRRPAPCLGQHNTEVYTELGMTAQDLAALRQAGAV
jgi:crotonobetainyl-CoA:carnitine CoA-transferase CaiB-like acyl-CoA transferase